MNLRTALLSSVLFAAATLGAGAQTIYPIDRAEILAGAKFDFKVEFPDAPAQADVEVTINGQDPAAVLGGGVSFVQKEDGLAHSALWVRNAMIGAPGKYTVVARRGTQRAEVTWEVFGTPAPRRARNVILFIGDGLSVGHRTAARILTKGLKEGKYGGELVIDDMPAMALISTSGTDAVVTDSANAMSAYTTGHKSCVNALGVYCAANKNTLDHPKVETIAELAKRRLGMAVGVVTNTEIEDATPAAMIGHTRRRADFNDIVKMYYAAQPEVILGGGSPNFLPKSTGGSKRTDDEDFIAKFKAAGYAVVSTNAEMAAAAAKGETTKLLGLFNTGNIDGAFDLRIAKKGTVAKFPDQPDVVQQTKAALDILSRAPNGFILMVESGRIDKYSHNLDWERSVYDTIMLDNAVKMAKDFAGSRDDTLIIVVADHTHPISIVGTYDDARPGELLRDKLGVYADSKVPNYGPVDADGYPTNVDTSRRLAVVYGAFPDYCDIGRPYMDGEPTPAVAGPDKKYTANPAICQKPGAVRREGNLPYSASQGVHSGDDVVLTAMGPGSERFRGHKPNTFVFRVMAEALALAGK